MKLTLALPEVDKGYNVIEKQIKEVSFCLEIPAAKLELLLNYEKKRGSVELVTVIKDDVSAILNVLLPDLEKDIGFTLNHGKRLSAYLNSKQLKGKYDDVLKIPVEELTFQAYIKKAFIREGYLTVGDIAELNVYQITAFPEFGSRSAKEIEQVLKELGVMLAEPW